MNYRTDSDLKSCLAEITKNLEGISDFITLRQRAYEFLARDLEQCGLPKSEEVRLDYDMDRVETVAFLMNALSDYGASTEACLRIAIGDLKRVIAQMETSTTKRETSEGGDL